MPRTPSDEYQFIKDELPALISQNIVGTASFHHEQDGATYEYGLLDPAAVNVHFAVGMPHGQNLFGSTAIPQELLPFYLGHEIHCNRKQAGEVGRCASIEETLIQTASPEILQQVLQARRHTFEDLVSLYKIDVEKPANVFHAEIAGTALFLRSKMKELGIPEL